jgi:membrane protease YdiL (CAAX protease family)
MEQTMAEIAVLALLLAAIFTVLAPAPKRLLATAFHRRPAHLDNGPQPLPNWRYMILATIAGVAYGIVFRKSSTVLSSATLRMPVDWTKHFFF